MSQNKIKRMKILMQDFNKEWYFGSISREESDKLLMFENDGAYLVRDCIQIHGCYVLVVMEQGDTKKYLISPTGNKWKIDKLEFSTIDKLLTCYVHENRITKPAPKPWYRVMRTYSAKSDIELSVDEGDSVYFVLKYRDQILCMDKKFERLGWLSSDLLKLKNADDDNLKYSKTLEKAIDVIAKGTKEEEEQHYEKAAKYYEDVVKILLNSIEHDDYSKRANEYLSQKCSWYFDKAGIMRKYVEKSRDKEVVYVNPTNVLTDEKSSNFNLPMYTKLHYIDDEASNFRISFHKILISETSKVNQTNTRNEIFSEMHQQATDAVTLAMCEERKGNNAFAVKLYEKAVDCYLSVIKHQNCSTASIENIQKRCVFYLDRIEQLKNCKENQKIRINAEIMVECAICLDRIINVTFNCGHTACKECSENMRVCHICRKSIKTIHNIYM